jgi:hypothetical protein
VDAPGVIRNLFLASVKHTGEYEKTMRDAGAQVERKFPSLLTFPPLRIVLARKA